MSKGLRHAFSLPVRVRNKVRVRVRVRNKVRVRVRVRVRATSASYSAENGPLRASAFLTAIARDRVGDLPLTGLGLGLH